MKHPLTLLLFRSPDGSLGVSFRRERWPHGDTGEAFRACGSLSALRHGPGALIRG